MTKLLIEQLNTEGNAFANWYNHVVKRSSRKKQEIVDRDPELALRIFAVFKDSGIRQKFISRYKEHPVYWREVLFMRRDMGKARGLGIPDGHICEITEQEELARNLHFCGSPHSAGNYWRENQWGNVVRAYEEKMVS